MHSVTRSCIPTVSFGLPDTVLDRLEQFRFLRWTSVDKGIFLQTSHARGEAPSPLCRHSARTLNRKVTARLLDAKEKVFRIPRDMSPLSKGTMHFRTGCTSSLFANMQSKTNNRFAISKDRNGLSSTGQSPAYAFFTTLSSTHHWMASETAATRHPCAKP